MKLQGAESGNQKNADQNASGRTDRGSVASAASQDEQQRDWQDGQAGNLEEEDPLAERVRQAREAYAQAGISSYAAEAQTRAIDPRQATPDAHGTAARPAQTNQASDQAISDKQAALDSLLSVNYDEQHPVAGASANNAPTRAIPQNLGAQPSGAPGNLPTRQIHAADSLPTRSISGQAPEAAPTQQLGAHGALPTQQMAVPMHMMRHLVIYPNQTPPNASPIRAFSEGSAAILARCRRNPGIQKTVATSSIHPCRTNSATSIFS